MKRSSKYRMSSVSVAAGCVRALVLAALVVVIAACARTPPEQALRDTVAELQRQVEARDAAKVQALLDDDFVGPDGMDRRGARQLATVMLMRHRSVGLTLGPLDVRMQGDERATVQTTAALTGGSGALLPDSARAYRVESAWRRRGDDWRMLSLRWEPVM